MARILHVSDWHVGASLYRCDRAPDLEAVLAETVDVAARAAPDLVLHTGDVFDALMPGHRAMRQATDALQALAEIAPVVVLAGNHDHPRLFEVFARLSGTAGRIMWVPRVLPPAAGGIIDVPVRSGERLRIAPVPFIHQNRFVDWFGESTGVHATYADRLRAINGALHEGLVEGYDPARDVLVYAAHVHVEGAVLGGSERRVHVTQEYATGAETLPAVSYAALGHIHKPQAVEGPRTAEYAGSPLALDFAERDEAKSVVLVECEPGRPAQVERIPLTAGRRLRLLHGSLEAVEAQAPGVGDAIVKVVVDCEDPIDGLVDRVRELLPEATLVEVVENAASRRLEAAHLLEDSEARELTIDELFDEYLAAKGTRTVPAATVQSLWRAVQAAGADADGAVTIDGLDELMTADLPVPS